MITRKHMEIFNGLTLAQRSEFLLSIPADQRALFAYGPNAGRTIMSPEQIGGFGSSRHAKAAAQLEGEKLLKLLEQQPRTTKEIAKLTGNYVDTIRRRLQRLRDMGLAKVDGKRGTYMTWVAA